MTLLEIIELEPNTVEVFHKYDQTAGTCLVCSNLFDSLESVATQYNIKLDELMQALKNLNE